MEKDYKSSATVKALSYGRSPLTYMYNVHTVLSYPAWLGLSPL